MHHRGKLGAGSVPSEGCIGVGRPPPVVFCVPAGLETVRLSVCVCVCEENIYIFFWFYIKIKNITYILQHHSQKTRLAHNDEQQFQFKSNIQRNNKSQQNTLKKNEV